MKKIILASGSPRRSELMRLAGLDFEVITSNCDEHTGIISPEETVSTLSKLKCKSVAEDIMGGRIQPVVRSTDGFIVIGADTIVVLGESILGKPVSREDAVRMLSLLSGRVHTVITGVTVFDSLSGEYFTFTEHTDVEMYALKDEEILDYVNTGEPMDKAGSYGIQGRGGLLVKRVSGDYYNVVGLPIARLVRELNRFM